MQSPQRAPLRVHFFQHIRDEGFGSLADWLDRRQAQVTATAFFDLPAAGLPELPRIGDLDLLVILGGAMSVNDEDQYRWLAAEKAFIRQWIEAGKPVVGLCLGAQLIASSLGASVHRNAHKEIGWWPVQAVQAEAGAPGRRFEFPAEITPLSWHGDTFDLPTGAVLLAHSDATRHQAFQFGQTVLGFQFHPESTPRNLQLFLADDGYRDLTPGPYVQRAAQLLAAPPAQFWPANQLLEQAVEFVLAGQAPVIKDSSG